MSDLLRSYLIAAAPILLVSLGGLYTYHANIFNIAMEGMMLIGAFCGVAFSWATGSWVTGIIAGLLSGVIVGAVFSFFTLVLHTDEFVTGIAVNLFALGSTTYVLRQAFGVKGAFISQDIIGLPYWPFFSGDNSAAGLPFIVYLAIPLAFVVRYHLYSTRFGLRLLATGESRRAVEAIGINARAIKMTAIMISGALCGVAGVSLSLGSVTLFAENMTNGRGWVALAIIILTRGRPLAILAMTLLFGVFDELGLSLQQFSIPSHFTQMTPYIATIIALYFYSRKKRRA